MPIPSGRYWILNVHWENLVVLLDANDQSDLVGYVQGLENRKCGDVVRLYYSISPP